jgi:hypothetical protein
LLERPKTCNKFKTLQIVEIEEKIIKKRYSCSNASVIFTGKSAILSHPSNSTIAASPTESLKYFTFSPSRVTVTGFLGFTDNHCRPVRPKTAEIMIAATSALDSEELATRAGCACVT